MSLTSLRGARRRSNRLTRPLGCFAALAMTTLPPDRRFACPSSVRSSVTALAVVQGKQEWAVSGTLQPTLNVNVAVTWCPQDGVDATNVGVLTPW